MKTQLTLDIEETLYNYCLEQHYAVVEEVSLPEDLGIVDTLSIEMKNGDYIFRCYEIKVSKSDFRSKARLTFSGHLNYFVLPFPLYEQVKGEIPEEIGVLVYRPFVSEEVNLPVPGFLTTVKKPKGQVPLLTKDVFFSFFLHSLQREVTKAKRVEKGLQHVPTEKLLKELSLRLNEEELPGALLATFSTEKIGQLSTENIFLKEQLTQLRKKFKTYRRKTRPLN